MTTSFKAIAELMDPVQPPASLRELIKCHRWVGADSETGLPPEPLSFRSITDRHDSPGATKHRFLVYNTFLMRADVSMATVLDAVFTVESLLARFPLAPMDAVIQLIAEGKTDKLSILGLFGIGVVAFVTVVAPAVLAVIVLDPTGGLAAAAAAAFVASMSAAGFLEALGNDFGKSPLNILTKLFPKPSGLLQTLGFNLPVTSEKKPALDARAIEIPDAILKSSREEVKGLDEKEVKSYVAALTEVWNDDIRQTFINRLSTSPLNPPGSAHRNPSAMIGPEPAFPPDDPAKISIGSGLLVVGLNEKLSQPPLPDLRETVFSAVGITRDLAGVDLGPFVDPDVRAKKGVMLVLLDAGGGRTVELYVTHLYNGGELIGDAINWLRDTFGDAVGDIFDIDVKQEEKLHIRALQLKQFQSFFTATHDARNVALFVGDLNLNALDAASSKILTDTLDPLGLKDAWPTKVKKPDGSAAEGFTNGKPDMVCKSKDGVFCVDTNETTAGGARIDYVFVSDPTAEQSYNLDLTRIRRRHFPRDNATEGQAFLSDHLGLEMILLVSPKT